VQHDAPLSDQLQVVQKTGPFSYLWIAASNRGTLVKIDTRTGEILGEYSSNPDTGSSTAPNPSRTTVALDGSVWAGNRGDGSVIHIGLVEEGQCIDRNGNGVIETSTGYNKVLAWPNPGNVNSGGGVSQAFDECILHYVKVKPSVPRSVSVDRDGNIWVSGHGGTNDRVFQLIDGKSGAILRTAGPFACGGYGGVVDKNGIVWSVYWNSKILRWDPSVNPPTAQSLRCIGPSDLNGYGISLGRSGDIYVTDISGEDVVWKISPDGNTFRKIPRFSPDVQGVAVDDNEQAWTASSRWSSGKTIDHLDGNTLIRVGQLASIPTGTTGVAVDAAGKIWAAADQGSSVIRIDPKKGAIGAGGIRIGAVDLTVSLPASTNPTRPLANPYNYSDMTGYLAVRNTAPLGRWRVIQDAGIAGALWGRVSWNGEGQGSIPTGASILVEARAAESVAGLGGRAFVTVTNGVPFSLIGRYVEVRVTLRPNASGQSPVLSDLRIETVDRIDPAVISIAPATVTEGNVGFISALFPVTLSHSSEQEILVDWRAEAGSAEAGVDFEALSGTLAFAAGTTEATIELPVRGDLLPELDESYLIDLERPVGAVLGASQALGTILDDDAPAQLSIGDVQVIEGDAGIVEAIFPVTLSAPAGQPVRFDWTTEDGTATAGGVPADYLEASSYLVIPAGETAAQIVIEVAGDLDPEADETFPVVLANASGATLAKAVGIGTILDDDTALLAIDDVTVSEGDSGTTLARFTVSASKPARVDLSVDFATFAESATEETDYRRTAGTLTIPAGASNATIDVPVVGDLLLEPDETFRLELSNPVRAQLDDAVGRGTIVDDEQCLGPDLIVNPGAEGRPVPSLGGDLPGWTEVQGSTWSWRRAPSDPPAYEGVASFAAGAVNVAELRQDIPVGAYAAWIDDGVQRFAFRGFVRSADSVPADLARIVVEYRDATDSFALESFDSLDIASPGLWEEVADVRTAPVGTRFVRIRLLATSADGSGENGAAFDGLELASLRTAAVTVTGFDSPEGDSGLHDGIFALHLSCPFSESVAVDVATVDATATAPSDYLARSGRVTFPPGAISSDFPVPVVGDTVDEPHETVHLDSTPAEMNGAVLLTPRATGTIRNDDACQRTPGYWALHPTLWPVDWLLLGNKEYERPALQAILNETGKDMSMTLARQLIATKFNLLVGTKPGSILGTVAEADSYLTLFPPGSNPKGPDKTQGEEIKNALQAYNSKLCPTP
jgi:hypothetical protein